MRIISQDGTMDTPYESCTVWVGGMNGAFIYAQNIGEDERVTYATYSTPEKAQKAMEMLRNAYMEDVLLLQNIEVNLDDYEKTPNWFKEKTVIACRTSGSSPKIEHLDNFYFHFPKDEELE